ncbi:MAG: DUF3073 domain-containing protein [Antricoccus sp.]
MGRGRAKAKQTKVARELKYFSPDTDLTALQRELAEGTSPTLRTSQRREERVEPDPYDDLASKYADYDDERR